MIVGMMLGIGKRALLGQCEAHALQGICIAFPLFRRHVSAGVLVCIWDWRYDTRHCRSLLDFVSGFNKEDVGFQCSIQKFGLFVCSPMCCVSDITLSSE
jgi:hypothetical protein